MRPQAVTIRLIDGDVEAEGFPTPVPGLVIVTDPDGDGYDILHASSGVCAGVCFGSPEGALAAAGELGKLLDWSQPGCQIRAAITADDTLDERLREVIHAYGGNLAATQVDPESLSAWEVS